MILSVRKILILVPAFLFFVSLAFSSYAPENEEFKLSYIKPKSSPQSFIINPYNNIFLNDIKIKGGLLFDLNTNEIVWQKNLYESMSIASITKLMTIFLVIEDIESHKINWNTMVRINKEASIIGGSQVYIKYGEYYSVFDLVKASLVSSGNDATYMLADFIAGSQSLFVKRMNETSKRLGMKNTSYYNSTGLPSEYRFGPQNFSSPADLLLLTKEILKHDYILNITGLTGDVISCGRRHLKIKPSNPLVRMFSEVDGLKTGYTDKAGYCIVFTTQRADRRIIGIVLGAPNKRARVQASVEMINNFFTQVGVGKLGEWDCPENISSIPDVQEYTCL